MNAEELIKKSQEKQAKKKAKKGVPEKRVNQQARVNVRNIQNQDKNQAPVKKKFLIIIRKRKNARPDSITARANMVRKFDEKNNKKKK